MAIQIKNPDQLNKLRDAGKLVAQTHHMLAEYVRPNISTGELDRLAEEFIRKHGGMPSFKGYAPHGAPPFPGTICASLNEVICHGIPSTRRLKEGDIIAIDVGLVL